jgi:hypothetical protein
MADFMTLQQWYRFVGDWGGSRIYSQEEILVSLDWKKVQHLCNLGMHSYFSRYLTITHPIHVCGLLVVMHDLRQMKSEMHLPTLTGKENKETFSLKTRWETNVRKQQ